MSEKKKNRKKKKEPMFLIDYDLPKNSQCRQQFYRKLKSLKSDATKSTKSVVLFKDPKKAVAIHKKAHSCGKAGLYKVRQLKKS